jgi:hypothetical protein
MVQEKEIVLAAYVLTDLPIIVRFLARAILLRRSVYWWNTVTEEQEKERANEGDKRRDTYNRARSPVG